ncbi:MAG: hypothetical protein WCO71_12285, partial [Pseudomonadota bacterium]
MDSPLSFLVRLSGLADTFAASISAVPNISKFFSSAPQRKSGIYTSATGLPVLEWVEIEPSEEEE